ncbi:hypothetical protein WKI13_02150 [Teredinibacter turnerae]|uniref:hypothetical protein n=1 Tax=Teredinibacter turnerae TaxID=2426 RepID=UPI000476229E|nr:hypothetical protein [Teredinibacter turnerae]
MTKEQYHIARKSDFICLTILLHDLKCFDDELSEGVENISTVIHKMRSTRNVFVSLHSLKDAMNRIRIDAGDQFVADAKSLRRDLDFIAHIRNKGVGHLDKTLLERAAQWIPEIFHIKTQDSDEQIAFLSYKAILEAAINSYLNEDGEQKIFKTEIDFLYPPDAQLFFEFLSDIVKRSIDWLENARKIIKSEIEFHSDDKIKELGIIAGQTNFNLKDDSDFLFSDEALQETLISAIEKMREIGVEEETIQFLESKVFK